MLWLWKRELEIHLIVDSIVFDKDPLIPKNFVVIEGSEKLGRDAIIMRALDLVNQRKFQTSTVSDDISVVDLRGLTSMSEAISKVADVLKLFGSEQTEKSLLKSVNRMQYSGLVIYFKRWPDFDRDEAS